MEKVSLTYVETIIEMSRNNDYTTGNLLDVVYFRKNCKLIAIDLSKQSKLKDPQQISFIGKLLAIRGATMFFIIEKSEDTTLNFSQNSVTIIQIMKTQKIVTLLNGSRMKTQNLQQKNGMLLTVSQKVNIYTTIQ